MKIRRDTPETSRAFFVLAVICFALVAFLSLASGATPKWHDTPPVEYINEGSPVDSEKVEEAIDYVVWSWGSRIPELELRYVGLTLGPISNAVITFRWLSVLDHFTLTDNLFAVGAEQKWVYLDSGFIARSVISMNAGWFSGDIDSCDLTFFSHELGHSLGAGHSLNSEDVMYYAPAKCRPTPTDADIRLTGNVPTTCYTEMTKDYDLFIPEIQGKEAYLRYEGEFIWKLDYLADKIPRDCREASFNWASGELQIDVKGRNAGYSARFQQISDDKFQLVYAEDL